jgi:hypothetical protein
MLDKRSLNSKAKVYMEGKLITNKEIIVNESISWNEVELNLFRKMLRQGGNFKIGGRKFKITRDIKYEGQFD